MCFMAENSLLLTAYIMSEMADADYEEPLDSDKTPVTIVTGFLGSGKTTLGKLEVLSRLTTFFVLFLIAQV